MQFTNLNHVWVDNDGNFPNVEMLDNSIIDSSRSTQVYFRDLEAHLIRHIAQADAVLGCAAWLTSGPILDALARKNTAIVVQKEDFLRPDLDGRKDWKTWLRGKYDALIGLDRFSFDNVISKLSYASDPSLDSIRCVGNYSRDKAPASPRMHNKFVLFAKVLKEKSKNVGHDDDDHDYICGVEPYAVWTGSFNLSKNAGKSLENALFITDPEIVQAYYSEFAQIVAISEPLDWEEEWSAPQWRIGS